MKRLNGTVLVLLTALILASCSTSEPSPTTAAPTTTAAPATTAPTTTAAPATTAAPTADTSSYVIRNFEGVEVTLALPIGWTGHGLFVNNGGDSATTLTGIEIWSVEQTYTDPCHWGGAELAPPLGPTVDDLATALQNQLTREATTSDLTLDGYSGKLVKMTVPADAVLADCDFGEFRSWVWGLYSSRWAQGPGQHDDVYILDVDGLRLVIDAIYYDGSPAADRAAQLQIVETAQIEPA